jgi:hypothetical protein
MQPDLRERSDFGFGELVDEARHWCFSFVG